jgi:hypothetical protein
MEQRLSVVTLGVADLERARRFYEEGLGWRRGNDHDEVVFFQIGGAVLALYPRPLLAEDAKLANDGQGFDGDYPRLQHAHTRGGGCRARPGGRRRGQDPQTRPEHLLGRLFRLLRRSRRPRVGDRLEPGLDDRGRRQREPAQERLTTSHASGVMPMKFDHGLRAVGIVWYRQADWPRLRTLLPDADKLPIPTPNGSPPPRASWRS